MGLRLFAFVAFGLALAVGSFAAGNPVYSVKTALTGGTTATSVTKRNCMISPSTGAFPQQTVAAATVSVLAGYTATIGATTLCCAFYGQINHSTGNCEHQVCSYGGLDQLAYDGFSGNPQGSFTTVGYGTAYFFASTNTYVCLPVDNCYEIATPTAITTTEPYVQSGSGGDKNDNFYNKPGVPSTTAAVSSVRTAWFSLPTDYSVTSSSNGDYIIPAGYYSAYEVAVSALTACNPAQANCCAYSASTPTKCLVNSPGGALNPTKYTKLACRDRGAYDGINCYLPCGQTFQDTFVQDQFAKHANSVDPTDIPNSSVCYANCVAHA